MKKIPFVKYTLCGNKFVIVDEIKKPILTESEKPKFAFHATDIYYGIGSDNFLVVQPCNPQILKDINDTNNYWNQLPDSKNSDYIFRMFEPDGNEAYSCGNGLMCIANYLYRQYGIQSARVMTEIPSPTPKNLTIGTDLQNNLNWSNMGHPEKIPPEIINSSVAIPYDDKIEIIKDIKIEFQSDELNVFKNFSSLTLSGFLIFTGEPHLVVFTETGFLSGNLSDHIFTLSSSNISISKTDRSRIELSSRLVHKIGMAFNEDYLHYFPKGININFVRVLRDSGVIEFRCFERGINRETWACGTGAVAAAFIARHLNMLTANEITLWPYLSRLRDHNAKLIVTKIENDYFLQGNSVFIFEGNYPFNENTNKMPILDQSEKYVQHSEEDHIRPSAEPAENDKFLSGNPALFCRGVYPFEDIINTIYHISAGKKQALYSEQDMETEKKEIFQISYISFSARLKLIAGTLILLILALGFNALLSTSSLNKLYLESVVSRYSVIGKDLQQHIENLPVFWENTKTFIGMDRILNEAKNRVTRELTGDNTVSVSVALTGGVIRYSTDKMLVSTVLPKSKAAKKKKSSFEYVKYKGRYVVTMPLRNSENEQHGTIAINFGEKQIKTIHHTVFIRNIISIAIIASCCAMLLIFFNVFMLKKIQDEFPKRKIFTAIFLSVILSQIIFSGLNINSFNNYYLQINTHNEAVTYISKGYLSSRVQETVLDSITVLVISVFFFVEMLILFFQFIERQLKNAEHHTTVHYSDIRPAFFLLLFGFAITTSFVPLYMEKLYEPIPGLSKELVLSLPVSAMVFFSGISFLIAGAWIDRRGWHEPFFTGVSLAGAGFLYAWMAPNGLHFIISRGISGLGYGLFFMAAQGFVMLYTDKNMKARGFAVLFAGLYAGSICGNATGAMIAEQIGYRPVFMFGAVIVFSVIGYTILFMRNSFKKTEFGATEKLKQSVKISRVFRFLFNRNVFSLILLSSIPANMAMIGFLNYFNPVYLNKIGTSQSNIGRTFMIYGFFQIYIGPLVSKYIDSSENKKTYIIAGGILGSLACIIFYCTEGRVASVSAMCLLGLSQSFVFVSQATYLLKLKVTRELGEGKGIAIFRSVNRLGQAVGPLIFGCLITVTDISKGITYFGFAYLFIVFLFLIAAQSDRKIIAMEKKTA